MISSRRGRMEGSRSGKAMADMGRFRFPSA
jgi:hypothetical protein